MPAPWGERLRIFESVPEPIRAVVMPNPQWIADIVSAGAQQTGEADLPWGRQWTERTPWLWPLENMVLWGLGVPLGVAAWLGVGLVVCAAGPSLAPAPSQAGSQATGHRAVMRCSGRWDLVLHSPGLGAADLFLAGDAVRQVGPLLSAHLSLPGHVCRLSWWSRAWDWARARRRWAKVAAGALAAVVLLGTLAWAFAFIQIYTRAGDAGAGHPLDVRERRDRRHAALPHRRWRDRPVADPAALDAHLCRRRPVADHAFYAAPRPGRHRGGDEQPHRPRWAERRRL